MTNRVVITGIGTISSLGIGNKALYTGMVEGRTAFSDRSFNDPERFPLLPRVLIGAIENFSAADFLGRKGIRALNRESRVFMTAAVMACKDAGLDQSSWGRKSVGVFCGSCFAGLQDYVEMFTDGLAHGVDRISPSQGPQTGFNSPPSQLAIYVGAEGPNLTVSNGATSSVDAIAYGSHFIREKRALALLVGGVETLSFFAVYALASTGCLGNELVGPRPFDHDRKGPVYAEAGVVLVLEDYDQAHRRGARVLVEICGAGSAFEPDQSAPALEQASKRAITEALDSADIDPERINVIFASANGHTVGDAAEVHALHHVFGEAVPVYAVKGVTGECLGASGALQVAAASFCMNEHVIPATKGFVTPDPDLPPLHITREYISSNASVALVHSIDTSGHATSLVLRAQQSS